MARLQHIALKTNHLEKTRTFYRVLGLEEANYDSEIGRLWLSLENGFTLIFDRSNETLSPGTVKYLGLELPDFKAVDQMYEKLAPQAEMGRDMRELTVTKEDLTVFSLRTQTATQSKSSNITTPTKRFSFSLSTRYFQLSS